MIAAEGEQKASHALKAAAEVIQQSPAALQVGRQGGPSLGNWYGPYNRPKNPNPDSELEFICKAQSGGREMGK